MKFQGNSLYKMINLILCYSGFESNLEKKQYLVFCIGKTSFKEKNERLYERKLNKNCDLNI